MSLHSTIIHHATHTKRMDCPRCGGRATLSITKAGGEIKYNCYRAACGTRGVISYSRTTEEIKQATTKNQVLPKPFVIQPHIIQGLGNLHLTQWAKENNVLQAYENRLTNIYYDPKLDRLCFELRDLSEKVVGLVGRAVGIRKPKWWVYDGSRPNTPFKCGTGKTLVLVEDCASACSVARVEDVTGMALLGTEFHAGYVPFIRNYDEIIICLDDDAKRKAVNNLLKRLEVVSGKPVSIMFTTEDLKKLSLQNLESMVLYAK